MWNRRQFVRLTAAVLVAFGLVASVLPAFAAEPAGPQWSRGLPIYQISPRFYSKDGSLTSIEADLPRIKAMNVGIIYMMPIHPCTDSPDLNAQRKCNYFQSADYMAVNPVLGTMDDWKHFVQAVHDSGMYLILDYVPRHCSWQNPLVTERPDWFSGTSWGLPAFDFARQDVRDYHLSVMERKKGDNVVFVVLNISASQTIGTISDALPEGDFTEAFTNGTGPLSRDVDLPGWGYRVYVKDTPPRPSH